MLNKAVGFADVVARSILCNSARLAGLWGRWFVVLFIVVIVDIVVAIGITIITCCVVFMPWSC
jgi:hypothetical protein